jgi:hypothetical protein
VNILGGHRMKLSPRDENTIIWMILRDVYNILASNKKFDFHYASKVKLQKVVFLIAETLDIPLTRSWYRHGGYVHNRTIDFTQLYRLPSILSTHRINEIEKVEQALSDIHVEYYELLHTLVPRVFFMNLEELLEEVYSEAPKKYRPLYFTNLTIEHNFELVKNFKKSDLGVCQSTLTYHIKERNEPDFSLYKKFANDFSELALNIADVRDFSQFYDCLDVYTNLLEDCLVKMSFLDKISLEHFFALKTGYERAIWNPLSLKISINTVKGLNAEAVKLSQQQKFSNVDTQIYSQLSYLKRLLSKDKMLPTLEERTKFFKSVYGNDTEFLGAISDVWKSYK